MQNNELEKKSNRLLSCPFCGGEAHFLQMGINKDIKLGYIKCKECGLRLEQENCTEDFATAQWNTRKPMERIVEQLEEELVDIGAKTGYYKGITKSIEIVRKGGVDNAG